MKTLTAFLLLFPLLFFAQNQEVSKIKVVEVYSYTNGIRDVFPIRIIEISKEKTEVFNTRFGIKEITPKEVIIKNKVFEVNGGIQNLFPKQEVVPTTPLVRDYFNFLF